jgi:hypothetical protein
MMRILFLPFVLCVCFCLHALQAFSATPAQLFQQGNIQYSKSRYAEALRLYRAVEQEGVASAELYLNLGNAAFRCDSLALAIWYNQKALRLAPSDADALANARFFNSRTADRIESLPHLFLLGWWENLVLLHAGDVWGWYSIIFALLSSLSLAVFFAARTALWRKLGFYCCIAFLLAFGSTFGLASAASRWASEHEVAVVFEPSLTLRSGPQGDATALGQVHEGAVVTIQEKRMGWCRLRLENGNLGWAPESTVRPI